MENKRDNTLNNKGIYNEFSVSITESPEKEELMLRLQEILDNYPNITKRCKYFTVEINMHYQLGVTPLVIAIPLNITRVLIELGFKEEYRKKHITIIVDELEHNVNKFVSESNYTILLSEIELKFKVVNPFNFNKYRLENVKWY